MAHNQVKNFIHKVAIVGAGGNSGKFITEALLRTGKHTVTALTRADSTNTLPHGVHTKHVDYAVKSTLVDALRGQDALVITLAATAPKDTIETLLEAAAEAEVPWVLPNEWGADPANEELGKEILIGVEKRKQRELVEKLGKSSWIAVSTGFWYEWSLSIRVAFGFDFDNHAVTLFDEGETRISISTWPQVGRAVANLLSLKIHPDGQGDHSPTLDRFRNNYVYVASFTVSQKDILQSVLRVTNTTLPQWKVTKEPVQDRFRAGHEELKKGNRLGFAKALYARLFYPDGSGNVEELRGLHNDVLGLPKEDLDEFTKIGIERSKGLEWNKLG